MQGGLRTAALFSKTGKLTPPLTLGPFLCVHSSDARCSATISFSFSSLVLDGKGHTVLYFVLESVASVSAMSVATFRESVLSMEPMMEEIPFLWAQSLHLITRLTKQRLVSLSELDPLGLHLRHQPRHSGLSRSLQEFKSQDVVVQVALISETTRLQSILATHGIPTQTQKQVEPIKIKAPGDLLMKVFERIGENKKLGLSGRPNRPFGALGTSKVYKIFGQTVVFYPTDSMIDFYTSFDVKILIHQIKFTLTFLNLYWNMRYKPTLCLYLTEDRLKGSNFGNFINFLAEVKQGQVGGVKLHLNRLQALISTSCMEHLEFAHDVNTDKVLQNKLCAPLRHASGMRLSSMSSDTSMPSMGEDMDVFTMDNTDMPKIDHEDTREELEPHFSPADVKGYSSGAIKKKLQSVHIEHEGNILAELYLLHELVKRNELVYLDRHKMTIMERMEELYELAGQRKHWKAVRLAAAILGKVVDTLAPAITSMLVRGKEVTVGVFGYPEHIISEPLSPKVLVKLIYDYCLPYDPIEAVLQQEIIIYLGVFVSSTYRDTAFDDMLRIRVGWIIQAMKRERARIADDNKTVQHLAPYDVMQLLIHVLVYDDTRTPLDQRQLNGALNRVPKDFYIRTFSVLERLSGGIQVRGRSLSQLPTVLELVPHEKGFALKVEELFSNITQPEYRQVIVELLMVVSTVLERNPELKFEGTLDLDEILKSSQEMHRGDLVRTGSQHEDVDSSELTGMSFYALSPEGHSGTTSYMARSVVNKMLQEGLQYSPTESCVIS